MTTEFGDPRMPARFWDKVAAQDGCWVWTASLSSGGGYPQLAELRRPGVRRTRTMNAARLAYEVLVGPLPKRVDWLAVRVCGNGRCVHPGHLQLRTDLVTASVVARAIGTSEERVGEWAREGLVPSHPRGKERRYRISEVAAAASAMDLKRINGVLYRNTLRGSAVRRREAERGGQRHTCPGCGAQRPLEEFPLSGRSAGIWTCRACRRVQHAREREALSVGYVKDQLVKKTGIKSRHLPSAMVEAHRAHLQVTRIIIRSKTGREA